MCLNLEISNDLNQTEEEFDDLRKRENQYFQYIKNVLK